MLRSRVLGGPVCPVYLRYVQGTTFLSVLRQLPRPNRTGRR